MRDTSVGQGLLAVGGRQYPFDLEGNWKSDSAPRVDMTVDVQFTADGAIAAIHHVPDTVLAREQAQKAAEAAKEKGLAIASDMVARFGVATIAAIAALMVGWFALNTVTVQLAVGAKTGISFWSILGIMNSSGDLLKALGYGGTPSTGIYGFLAFAALAAPLAPYFWKDRRAHLASLLPLAFMLFVCIAIYSGIHDSVSEAQGMANAFGGKEAANMAAEMAEAILEQALKAISIGLGAYVSLAASIYLAAKGMIKFLATRS